jgi:hypothetical protein
MPRYSARSSYINQTEEVADVRSQLSGMRAKSGEIDEEENDKEFLDMPLRVMKSSSFYT